MWCYAPAMYRSLRSKRAVEDMLERHRQSDRDLGAHFHHPSGGNLEIVGGVISDAREHDEQAILPTRHAGMGSRLQRAPRQKERRRHDVELPAMLASDGE